MSTGLRELAPNLWIAEMPAAKFGFEFGARTTIVRLSDNSLWVHSPIALTPQLKSEVDALGTVRFVVTPYRFHYEHLAEWAQAYPAAQVWGAPGLSSETAKTRLHEFLDDTPNTAWSDVLDQAEIGRAV